VATAVRDASRFGLSDTMQLFPKTYGDFCGGHSQLQRRHESQCLKEAQQALILQLSGDNGHQLIT
jgi:hypothetical protein